MDDEKDILIRTFEENKALLKPILELSFEKYEKPLETSDQCRKNGNDLFKSKNHDYSTHYRILYNYCKSIATAPNKSDNLALSYGNKTVLLLHLEKYEDCIRDVDRTLTFAKSRTLKIKILCRKVECMKRLGLDCQSAINEAKRQLNKIDEDERKAYGKLIKKVEALPANENGSAESQEKDAGKLPEDSTELGAFAIQYSEADGRHLVATKDYKPGDVIFVENLFVSSADCSDTNHAVCQYCLKTCWSSVPCETCSWAMFCSEECKENAWVEFHDVECSLIPYLKVVNDSWKSYHLSIRTFIIGVRTAGSIDELRGELKSMSESSELSFKGYFRDGKFGSNSIQNVFLLNCDKLPDEKLEIMSLLALMTLIGLIKHTPLFKDISLEDIDDLIKYEDLVFLGSLLLKLIAIKSVNSCSVSQNLHEMSCIHEKKSKPCPPDCNFNGSCFAPLASLLKHSCMPNAARCFSEDKKVIVYALRPIECGSQIFRSHCVKFDKVSLKERKEIFDKFNIICECDACSESWPPILHLSKKYLKKYNYAISTDVEKEVYEDCKSLLEAVENNESYNFAEEDIEKLSEAIERAVDVKYPSYLTSLLIEAMDQAYLYLYGRKKEKIMDCKVEEKKMESSKSTGRKST